MRKRERERYMWRKKEKKMLHLWDISGCGGYCDGKIRIALGRAAMHNARQTQKSFSLSSSLNSYPIPSKKKELLDNCFTDGTSHVVGKKHSMQSV